MAVKTKKLSELELLETMPAEANVLLEVDGYAERIPAEKLVAGGGVTEEVLEEKLGAYAKTEDVTAALEEKQPVGDYATKEELAQKQPVGDYATATQLADLATEVDGKQPVGNYATAEQLGELQTAIDGKQPSGDYVTTEEMSAALEGKQPAGDYITNDGLNEIMEQIGDDYATKDELSEQAGNVAETYATKEELAAQATTVTETYATKEELTQGLETKQPTGDYATKTELQEQATAVSETYATKEALQEQSTAAGDTYATKEELTNSQADWNVNDETGLAFVKNRTHYEDSVVIEYSGNIEDYNVVGEQSDYKMVQLLTAEEMQKLPEWMFSNGLPSIHTGYTDAGATGVFTFSDGSTEYNVQIGGYDDLSRTYTAYPVGGLLVDEFAVYMAHKEHGLCIFVREDGSKPYITKIECSNVVKLDEKFIPDTVARMSDVEALFNSIVNGNEVAY